MAKDVLPGNGERRTCTTLSLSQLVPGVTRPAYRRRSPAGASLMTDWAAIVGPRLAAETEPRRLSGTALTIACSGPMAMELQHLAPVLIERINTHAGRVVVERLRFVQDLRSGPAAVLPRRVVAPVAVPGIDDPALNEALARLQASMKARRLP